MVCQNLFSGKNQKTYPITSLSSADLNQRMVMVKIKVNAILVYFVIKMSHTLCGSSHEHHITKICLLKFTENFTTKK